ncbi:lipocalin family protein [Algibacter miyuki]|uniref:Lipocalin family protein n=1 Tax=Algibacter miyuki TaxID=1306933 RepID=A0ABV5GUX8_9FLAO|nr:lipocalin family protein [Algibacter miyuki]MDN3664766.1 lipocalin family protein [Algibacter miyuki]
MKKIAILLVLALALVACGTSKVVRTSKKVMKGDWTLNSISYSETGTFNVSLLDDVSKACFEGSDWQFIPNNNSGVYTINDTDCSIGARNFIFTIQEIDPTTDLYDFLLKPTDEKGKSATNSGYRMQLAQLSETNMQWQQTLNVEGKPFTITMNFIKK